MHEYLDEIIEVIIDRHIGSKHPQHNIYYPVNYGYIPHTKAQDGEPIDGYVLGIYEPIATFTGKCIAIIERLNDIEQKLVLCPEEQSYTKDQILALTAFQERYFKIRIVTQTPVIKPVRNSVKAVIIENEKLLTLKKSGDGDDYYVLPGGGQNWGETFHQALKRECREETNAEIIIRDVVFIREYIGKNHEFQEEHSGVHQIEYMFRCQLVNGTEIKTGHNPDEGQESIEWLEIHGIENAPFYPLGLRRYFKELPDRKHGVYLGDIN